MARAIFGISGLLTDQHDACVLRPLSEYSLRGHLPEIAGLAIARGVAKRDNRLF
jgi:hypothetical protein